VNNLERFIARFPKLDPSKCWLYPGSQRADGYRNATYQGKTMNAHRAVWLAIGRSLPDGFVVDHRCSNRACANPDHLEPVLQRVNVIRGVERRLCHCDECFHKRHRNGGYEKRKTNARAGLLPIPHGTVNGYSNYGCRCDECRTAEITYRRERRHAAAVAS
jgi:hypothetical protein